MNYEQLMLDDVILSSLPLMPLSSIFSSCFRVPNEAILVALPAIDRHVVLEHPQGCGASVVTAASGAGRLSCGLNDEDALTPNYRNIPYSPKNSSQRPSFCLELCQPSTQMHPGQRFKVDYTTADELVKDVQNLRWLGQGAQGVVYEGTWQGATVAVKFSIVEDLDATAYELLFSRLLSHPNVVQTFVAKVAVLDEKTIRPCMEGCSRSSSRCSRRAVDRLVVGAASPPDGDSAATDAQVFLPTIASLYQPIQATGGIPVTAAAISTTIARSGGGSGGGGRGAAGRSSSRRRLVADPAGSRGCSPSGRRFSFGTSAVSEGCDVGREELTQSGGSTRVQQQLSARTDSFHSDDGFGNPFGRKSTFNDVREVLGTMGARPGHLITQMVMEHCDHGSLHSAIQRGIFKPTSRWGSKLALRALIRTVREVAQGMFHLHSNNVLHGDLKPANVLLINSRKDRRGYVAKVSDFGMAQFCTQGHISNAPWGTLVYMAPERLLDGQIFPASDVYSFGVILWEMYHGQRPYEGMHVAQIIMACAQGCTPLKWAEDSCPEIVRISRACMAPSPHDRPTFEYLMHELASLEARVRMDGVRISKSLDAGIGRPFSGSSGATAGLQYARSKTINGLPKLQVCSDVTVLPPCAAGNPSAAAAAAAIVTQPNRHFSHEASSHGAREALPGIRCSADDYCRTGFHVQACHGNCVHGYGGGSSAAPTAAILQGLPPLSQPVGVNEMRHVSSSAIAHSGVMEICLAGTTEVVKECCGGVDSREVKTLDLEADRGNNNGSAAAIAAALAQQPSIANAVVSELLALLQQQQQLQQKQAQELRPEHREEEQQLQQQLQLETDGTSGIWAATANARSSSRVGGGTIGGDFWRLSSGGLGAAAPPLQQESIPQPLLAFNPPTQDTYGSTVSTCCSRSPGCAGTSFQTKNHGILPAAPNGLQPPQRRSSCGGAVLGAAQAASVVAALSMRSTSLATIPTAAASSGIARSSTDSVLDSSGGGGAGSRGDSGAWGEGIETASMALSSPGRCLAAATCGVESPFTAADVGRDIVAAAASVSAAAAHHQHLLQHGHPSTATCGVPQARRRSSNLPTSRRNSNLPGWECTTITEEPM